MTPKLEKGVGREEWVDTTTGNRSKLPLGIPPGSLADGLIFSLSATFLPRNWVLKMFNNVNFYLLMFYYF